MVRYDEGHKRETRARIVETAARRFKASGIDGAGIATLMKDAGLTNGAFYGHFESKDDLVRSVVEHQLQAQRELLSGLDAGVAGLEQFARAYLSVEHRDDVAGGCPSAALLDELARDGSETRDAYTDAMMPIVDDLAARLVGVEPAVARVEVLGLFASMVGCLQLSRTLTDRAIADAVLEQGVQNALTLIASAVAGGGR